MTPVPCAAPCENDSMPEIMTDGNRSTAPVASAGAEGDVHTAAEAPLVQLRHCWRRGRHVGLCVLERSAQRTSHKQAGASWAAGSGEGQEGQHQASTALLASLA